MSPGGRSAGATPQIAYRDAEASDAEAVAALHARSWREHYRGEFEDAYLDGDLVGERLAVWRERLARRPAHQLVRLACDGGQLVGFVCVYGDHDPRWGSLIDNLHVLASAKRSGVGSSLMRQAGAWLAERHPDRGVYLLVLASNAGARRFYERLGATNAGESGMETHGGAWVRSCCYVWPEPSALAQAAPHAEGA
jgi:ribosomal protein S18 acetylase RimI-like enzyme